MRLPADTVYLALHYQNENCHPDGRIKYGIADGDAGRDAMLAHAKRLLDGVRSAGLPVAHVRLAVRPDHADVRNNCAIFGSFPANDAWREGTWGVEFLEGFAPRPGEMVVDHGRNSGFFCTRLDEYLRTLGTRRIVVSGVSTAYVVETTVRHAADIGYEIVVAHDACSTFRRDFHEASCRAMGLLATVAGVDDVLAALARPDGLDRLTAAHWRRIASGDVEPFGTRLPG